ncbi:MAG: ATP-binding cassette domain-containing protein [Clostridia bacterium]|nr:ATP-binding cassette domain-containing protein [Clostridia bacterium]
MSETNIIELKDVKLAYNKDYFALFDINLSLDKGDRVAVVGDTGSGKTALLRVIAGLEKPKSGECYIKGTPINKINFARDVSLGYLSTKAVFFERKSVYKNLMWALKVHKVAKAEREERINNILSEFGIEAIKKEKMKKLCSSDRRLVQIARMALRPVEIVLCDDVLSEYDADTQTRIRKALTKLFESAPKDKIIIMATRDEKECAGFTNRTLRLQSGSFVGKHDDK